MAFTGITLFIKHPITFYNVSRLCSDDLFLIPNTGNLYPPSPHLDHSDLRFTNFEKKCFFFIDFSVFYFITFYYFKNFLICDSIYSLGSREKHKSLI